MPLSIHTTKEAKAEQKEEAREELETELARAGGRVQPTGLKTEARLDLEVELAGQEMDPTGLKAEARAESKARTRAGSDLELMKLVALAMVFEAEQRAVPRAEADQAE